MYLWCWCLEHRHNLARFNSGHGSKETYQSFFFQRTLHREPVLLKKEIINKNIGEDDCLAKNIMIYATEL